MDYEKNYEQYKHLCESELARLLVGEPDSDVLSAMRYSLLSGGKRVRGVLALAACELVGGAVAAALPAACSIEMLHCYSLIHDDLPAMDDDELRRGIPSCHIKYGEATAILAGDALQTLAFKTLTFLDGERCHRCAALLADAAGHCGMVFGQELDLRYETEPADAEALERVHRHKTGCLLRAATVMGALCGGADEGEIALLDDYAGKVGLAFQIVDDILDVEGDEVELGKPIGSDFRDGKTSFVTLYGLERSRQMASELSSNAARLLTDTFGPRADFLARLAGELAVRRK